MMIPETGKAESLRSEMKENLERSSFWEWETGRDLWTRRRIEVREGETGGHTVRYVFDCNRQGHSGI